MKKIFFKTFLIFLTICIAATTFCGCGDNGKTTSSDKSKNNNVKSDKSLLTAAKFQIDEDMNFGGKELVIGVWNSMPERGTNTIYDRRYELADRVMEKYGITIKWQPIVASDFERTVALAQTSGQKYADLFFAPHYNAYSACKVGAAIPLDEYIDYSSEFYDNCGDLSRYLDGKHYSYMPDFYNVNDMGLFVLCNQALIDAAGCEDPVELYAEGKWTWSAFEEIVKKTTKKTGGKVTQYGIGNSNLIEGIMMSNGVTTISSNYETNKYESGFFTDAGYNALNFVKKLVADYGNNDNCYGTLTSSTIFSQSKMAMLIAPNYSAVSSVENGMPVVAVPLPTGTDVESGKQILGKEIQEWWLVSSISDFTPEQLVQIALDLNDDIPEYEETYIEDEQQFFIDLLYEQCIVTTEEEAELFYDLINADNTITLVDSNITDMNSIKVSIFNDLAAGNDARTVIDKYKPNIESILNK